MSGEGRRALARDVFIYDLQDFDTLLGGLVLSAGVTNANFYTMVDIIINVSPPGHFILQDDNGETVAKDTQPLLPGRYFVVADGTVEVVFVRAMSFQTGTRADSFKDQVRERDGRCVVTKEENLGRVFGLWTGFKAAHVFPLAYKHQWNGLLLRNDIHELFDYYHFSINPDDNYKIVSFQPDSKGIAGTFLDARLLDDPRCSDIMGDIRGGPKAAERMEFELFGRLAHHMDIYSEEKQDEEDEQGGNVSDKG
ncbi:hypothetical protein B0T25DRAFT_590485 [Lasiosphaeria hispida]|uniref:HNH nuclease domain-containing protein n=1 Tax=Lasiosphaeria hispida TaxID=260671 RepID=A0AAJ0MDN4_9PEZI|nr:hypothetical protein B0T25DRAFT_590485 [Lasiosphaeria hispida]